MRRKHIILTVVGLSILVLGLWTFENSLFNDRIEKVETYQISDVLGVKERRAYPVYAYPNEGVGSSQAGYDMYVLVNYWNVNGTLRIEDYYCDYGSMTLGQRLDYRNVVGNGSVVFTYTYYYIGLHLIILEPDYVPGYNAAIEMSIYTVHYAPAPQKDMILYSSILSLVGAILASIGIPLTVSEIKQH